MGRPGPKSQLRLDLELNTEDDLEGLFPLLLAHFADRLIWGVYSVTVLKRAASRHGSCTGVL